MGSNLSLNKIEILDDVAHEILNEFCSNETRLDENNPYWNQLLSFKNDLSLLKDVEFKLKLKTNEICSHLSKTNLFNGNYKTLVRVLFKLFDKFKEMPDSEPILNQLTNCLFLTRIYALYCVSMHENVFLEQIHDDTNDLLIDLIMCSCEILIQMPRTHTYLHMQSLNLLLILLSSCKHLERSSLIYEIFMFKLDERLISDLVQTLLENILEQMHTIRQESKGLVSSLWSIMTLGYGTSNKKSSNEATLDLNQRLLALNSCHILLVLSNYYTNDVNFRNPFRLALFHFTDTQNYSTNIPNSEPLAWFSIDYTRLYQIFCQTMHSDQYTLLLYMLLHRNQHFKMFILSRLDIDQLMVPLLKVIYSTPDKNSHHIYMALIILLILSEDELFNKSIHCIMLKNLTWYTERSISEISLGGLLVLIVIRTIQYNITRMRDKYLHTNCLAALANMSSKFMNLHSYVCQRLNSLFALLVKKHDKLLQRINADSDVVTNENDELNEDLATLEELMRMYLEIVNSCLINALHQNSNLVYSLIYNKHLYQQYCTHVTFQDVLSNIDVVINLFSNEIETCEDKSLENIKQTIDNGVRQFSRDRLKRQPELKFKYVEEDQPEDFFVPYIWSLISEHSQLSFTNEQLIIQIDNK